MIAVALFAFLLNPVRDLGQVPLHRDLPSQEHWAAIELCGRGILGNAAIAAEAFWAMAAAARSRCWAYAPSMPVVSPLVVWFVRRQLT